MTSDVHVIARELQANLDEVTALCSANAATIAQLRQIYGKRP